MFADFSSGSNMDPIAVGRLLLVVVVVWYINVFVTACSQWRDISTKNNSDGSRLPFFLDFLSLFFLTIFARIASRNHLIVHIFLKIYIS